MLDAGQGISVPESELEFDFVLSGGPGGQKVNRTASAVVLRFNAMGSPSLPEEVKERLRDIAGGRLRSDGVLVIHCRTFRSQARNREHALRKLRALLRKASRRPKRRSLTSPTAASIERRLQGKKRRSKLKRSRSRKIPSDDTE
ncbi:MAG: hypothetical protein AVO35_07530 [Candidatus Aegiribacteria sp. MLS_C]|nr:MAG: hypothetical protein AVO35_07530 [Candidatus Aegiribacteria sp. MLS_C]